MLRDVYNRNENAQRRCRKKAMEGGGIIRLFEGGITFLAIFLRYRSMVKTRDVNERRYGDTVSRDSAIAIHILNLSYLTISNLRIGEICADRIFFHPSIHAIFNNTNATTLPRNSNAILAIFPSPARRIRIFSRSEVRRKRKGRGCITR